MLFGTGKSISVGAGDLVTASLAENQNFVLSVAIRDIGNYTRWGNDLVVELTSGRTVRLVNFFINGAGFHKLTLLDDGSYIQVDFSHALTREGDGISDADVVYQKDGESLSVKKLLAILGGGALAAGGAVALSGGHDGDDHGGKGEAAPRGPQVFIRDNQEPVVGVVPNNGATNDVTPMLEGDKAIPGSTILIKIKGFDPISVTVNEKGEWSYTLPKLKDGVYEASIIQTNNGHQIGGETLVKFTVDTVAPDSPVLEKVNDAVTPVVGEVKDGDTINDTVPAFSGKGEPYALIRLYEGDKVIGMGSADKDGNWSFKPKESLSNGEHVLHVTATDAAGNESAPSGDFHVIIDTVPPAQLDMRGIELQGADGAVIKDGEFTTDHSSFKFTGKVGSVEAKWIEILGDNGQVVAKADVHSDGSWEWKFGGADTHLGWHNYRFRAVDAAGNQGPLTKLYGFEVRAPKAAADTPDPAGNEAQHDAAAAAGQEPHNHTADKDGHTADKDGQDHAPTGQMQQNASAPDMFGSRFSGGIYHGATEGHIHQALPAGEAKTSAAAHNIADNNQMNTPASGVSDSSQNNAPDLSDVSSVNLADLFHASPAGVGNVSAHAVEQLLAGGLLAPLQNNSDMDLAAACPQVII